MSRCFPYPPPGYEKNGISDQALIESIKKLQRDRVEADKEKKEKRREKKVKDKSREDGDSKKRKHKHKKEKRHKGEKSHEGQKIQDHHDKKRKLETENLEKSILTEEHGQSVGSQNSSDSTLNSNNNKRHKPSSPHESSQNSGSIIRIRLPLQRHKDPELSLPRKEQPCSASGRTGEEALIHRPCETALKRDKELVEQYQQPCSTFQNRSLEVKNFRLHKEEQNHSSKLPGLPHKASKEKQSCDKSGIVPVPSKEKQNHSSISVDVSQTQNATTVQQSHSSKPTVVPTVPVPSKQKQHHCTKTADVPHTVESLPRASKSSSKRKLAIVSQFSNLFENWSPPPIQDEPNELGDEEWLVKIKENLNDEVEIRTADSTAASLGPSSFWPRAHFLPAVDVYAMPYAVPF